MAACRAHSSAEVSDDLRLEIEPVEDHGEVWAEGLRDVLRRHPATAESDVRLVRMRTDGSPDKEDGAAPNEFIFAEAYNFTDESAVRIVGPVHALEERDVEALRIESLAYQPPPSDDELALAFDAVRQDDRLRLLIEREGLGLYSPMPPSPGPTWRMAAPSAP